MLFIPAIDIIDGKAVRLYQGDYSKETSYGDPLEIASQFCEAGARWIHLVDLQGAKDPSNRQWDLIEKIAKSIDCKVQLGGGVREMDDCEELLSRSVDRVLVGSSAIRNPAKVAAWVEKLGLDKIGLALDVRWDRKNPPVPWAAGWLEESKLNLEEIMAYYPVEEGLTVLCTDIMKDGTLKGPALDLYEYLQGKFPGLQLIASGGVRNNEDLQALAKIGVGSAVAGRSIYEGTLDWKAALATGENSC